MSTKTKQPAAPSTAAETPTDVNSPEAPERSECLRNRALTDLSRWLLSWKNADLEQLWYFGLAIKNHVGNMDTPVEDALVSMVESYGWSVNDPNYPECTIQALREHIDDAGHFFTDTLNIANYVNTRYPQALADHLGAKAEAEVADHAGR